MGRGWRGAAGRAGHRVRGRTTPRPRHTAAAPHHGRATPRPRHTAAALTPGAAKARQPQALGKTLESGEAHCQAEHSSAETSKRPRPLMKRPRALVRQQRPLVRSEMLSNAHLVLKYKHARKHA